MDISNYKKQFDTEGFTVLSNLITAEQCEYYKALLEKDYQRFAPFYASQKVNEKESLADKAGEKVVFNLHNKDIAWFTLFEHPEVLKLLGSILKDGSYEDSEPYYLYNTSARCPLKGHSGQQLHIDSNLPGINYCIIANVLWALDDFTIENGATRVVPGSHNWHEFASDGLVHPDEVRVTILKGSAIIFNGNLWHGGAENTTEESRWGVALGYARWFIKPSFDFMQNTPKDIYSKLSEAQKKLLGFNLTSPKDEFTRLRRRSESSEQPLQYVLPTNNRKE